MAFNDQPKCDECGRFIPYERATLEGKLDSLPSVGWDEWWGGVCKKCETQTEER